MIINHKISVIILTSVCGIFTFSCDSEPSLFFFLCGNNVPLLKKKKKKNPPPHRSPTHPLSHQLLSLKTTRLAPVSPPRPLRTSSPLFQYLILESSALFYPCDAADGRVCDGMRAWPCDSPPVVMRLCDACRLSFISITPFISRLSQSPQLPHDDTHSRIEHYASRYTLHCRRRRHHLRRHLAHSIHSGPVHTATSRERFSFYFPLFEFASTWKHNGG